MARPTNESIEAGDPYATREAMRMARAHLRRINLKLRGSTDEEEDVSATENAQLLDAFIRLWEQCRAAEKHHVDLLRNPPKGGAGKAPKPPAPAGAPGGTT